MIFQRDKLKKIKKRTKTIFSYVNQAEINSCVLLDGERQDGFWRKKGSQPRRGEKKRDGMREKEEEKGRRTEKSGTLSWRPHVLRFSLFTSMDTNSPPTVFILYFLVRLLS